MMLSAVAADWAALVPGWVVFVQLGTTVTVYSSIWSQTEPCKVRVAYSRRGSQPREGTGHNPGVEANRARRAGIFPAREPTTRGERAYSRRGSQPREESGHLFGAGANSAFLFPYLANQVSYTI
eukprot:1191530-Prorocentrum_minimum.AAC.1